MSDQTTEEPLDHVIKKRGLFFRPNRQGYTSSIAAAGRYTKSEAESYLIAEGHSAHHESEFTEQHGLDNERQVFFYEQDFYVLSNFSAFTLRWSGIRFDTSEAAYHWEKFRHAEMTTAEVMSIDVRDAIRVAISAHEAFKIAEANKHLRRADWDSVKVNVMRNILIRKTEQHEYVRRKLLATGDRELIENSWRDNFWGWGPNRDGKNMLGKLWMEVRAELRGSNAS